MALTKEQQAIIHSSGDIQINAVAGSGKTTTLIEYARARPLKSRILYLAFNKAVKLEAKRKFAAHHLNHVQVETAHSLAFKHIVRRFGYRINPYGYKTSEIAELLGLKGNGEKHQEYIIANHINKFITYFCNSDRQKVQELDYLNTVTDLKARTFVKTFYNYIERQTRILLAKMDMSEIDITHDFYLKKFQLSQPKLNYDFILFDEGQDASPAMLNVFLAQNATKVIVGDTHQQIYGWRHAINSLDKTGFKTYNLTTSFRFDQKVADLAMKVLEWKQPLNKAPKPVIIGMGSPSKITTKAILARTNLGLLLKAIEYATKKQKIKHIYFEGNINSYTYADEGASLYDVLNLYNGNRVRIKDKLITGMKDMDELNEYIKKTEDVQLRMMTEIVEKYGNRIPGIIKAIKEKHVKDEEKEKAEVIFSTVHRCKGVEYGAVQLVDDFISEKKIEQIMEERDRSKVDPAKLNEEINLLYVAITRTKNSIHIPESLVPKDFPPSPNIHIIQNEPEALPSDNPKPTFRKSNKAENEKVYTVEEKRQKHKNAYRPWSEELDDALTVMYCEGNGIPELAEHFGRGQGAIRSRIKKLELMELYG